MLRKRERETQAIKTKVGITQAKKKKDPLKLPARRAAFQDGTKPQNPDTRQNQFVLFCFVFCRFRDLRLTSSIGVPQGTVALLHFKIGYRAHGVASTKPVLARNDLESHASPQVQANEPHVKGNTPSYTKFVPFLHATNADSKNPRGLLLRDVPQMPIYSDVPSTCRPVWKKQVLKMSPYE